MKRLVSFYIMIMVLSVSAFADNITMTASAPSTVEAGDKFQVQYTVNTQDVSAFEAPGFKGFEVIYGPSKSVRSNVQVINGRASSSSSVTYTYVLLCNKPGTFTIDPATATVKGQVAKSRSLSIRVVPSGSNSSSSASQRQTSSYKSVSSSKGIGANDLFMLATASRTNVYEQEAVLITYKLYTLVNLTQLDGKLPTLDGFQIQEIDLPRNKEFSVESYNGKTYRTVVWSQYVVFPQKSGKLEIPSVTYEGVVSQANTSMDPIDAFFNGNGGILEYKKQIVAPRIIINVSPLPQKPADFSGAVGHFGISTSVNSNKIKTNDALTFTVNISGGGNMKLIKTPEVQFPNDFETYDPKVEDQLAIARDGLAGTKQFQYLAVPRKPGTYTIPAVKFTFFDTAMREYRTIASAPQTIVVEKGNGNSDKAVSDFTGGQRGVKDLNFDIRYIKTGDVTLYNEDDNVFGSWKHLLLYIIPLILFIILIAVGKKYMSDSMNVALTRGKKANKVATRRMKLAASLLKQQKKDEFYDEVLKALWGYVADKLNMPQEHLSKDNVLQQLTERSVPEDVAGRFIDALNDCEFARYAPGDANHNMEKLYDSAVSIINEIESSMVKS